jgi:hypothetical protein
LLSASYKAQITLLQLLKTNVMLKSGIFIVIFFYQNNREIIVAIAENPNVITDFTYFSIKKLPITHIAINTKKIKI